jgi:dimeric dUTPase (all-alpha-NTP-PPase superfamily)
MANITEEQLKTMIELQEAMNSRVTKEWRKEKRQWTDAIFTEAAEAFNHTNWEWWKNEGKPVDIPQIKLELIDIWHFLLSELITHEETEMTYYQLVSETITAVKEAKPPGIDFTENPEAIKTSLRCIAASALGEWNEDRILALVGAFAMAVEIIGMGWDEVFKLYVGKNTLNHFRQNHNYKADTDRYKDIWRFTEGKEDNEYLTDLLTTLDVTSASFKEDLYSALDTKYQELLTEYGRERPV